MSHKGKHHLNPMCPYVDLEAAQTKPADVYPELDVCEWCEERYNKWDANRGKIEANGCDRCGAAVGDCYGHSVDYCESCQRTIKRRQVR